jgi:hypothetical protein
MANSVMHWRIRTFLDMSAALLYIGHCNQANALILVDILVILTCLVNVKYCSDFYAEEEFILCVRDTDFCWVSKVSRVGRVRKQFWVNLRELSNFGEQLFRKIIWKFILNFGRTLGYIKEAKASVWVNRWIHTLYLLHFDCVNYGCLYSFNLNIKYIWVNYQILLT